MSWIIESSVDGGHVGTAETYWAPDNKFVWVFHPRLAKKYETEQAAEQALIEIMVQGLQWADTIRVVKFDPHPEWGR